MSEKRRNSDRGSEWSYAGFDDPVTDYGLATQITSIDSPDSISGDSHGNTRRIEIDDESVPAQYARQESQYGCDLYRHLFELSPVSSIVLDADGIIREANPSAASLLAETPQDLIAKSFTLFVDGRDRETFESHHKRVFETQSPQILEIGLSRQSDDCVLVQAESIPIPSLGEPLSSCLTLLSDITERKMTERILRNAQRDLEKRVDERTADLSMVNERLRREIGYRETIEAVLRRSEERYRAVVEDQTELICRFLADGTLTFVNEAYCRYFRRRSEDLLGTRFYDLIPHAERNKVSQELAALSSQNPTSRHEHRVVASCGTHRWQQWTNRVILNERGNAVEFQAVGRDITDRKDAEDQLLASLQEKDVLLKEIHHRVKNNLAMIYSLLGLQSRYVKDSEHRNMFKDAQARIKSMALAHEKLYQSDSIARLDVREYVESLTHHLAGSGRPCGCGIRVINDIDDVSLGLDTAIPLGFILTELVSNSLQHAFPSGEGGTVHVALKPIGSESLELTVRDDGVGIPEEFDLEQSMTFGLDLVDTFVNQLGGKVQALRENGTEFRVQFKSMKKHGDPGGRHDRIDTPHSDC